jgi:hypothetical protein
MKTDYCAYPPRIAADVEIAEQRDGDRTAFVINSPVVGRYLLLRTAEYRALRLLDDNLTPAAVCDEYMRRHGGTLQKAVARRDKGRPRSFTPASGSSILTRFSRAWSARSVGYGRRRSSSSRSC